MNEEQYSGIMKKLDLISNALLMNIVKDLEFKDQVVSLYKVGLTESEIVKLLKSNRDKVHGVVRKLI